MVCGGLGLFMEEADPTHVVCITGTKGKSTTTALAVHLLRGLGHDARAAGNIGHPPWDPASGPAPEYWVVETSSFQVPDLWHAPARGRGDLAVPGPPRLAHDGGALLRRQALLVHQAGCGAGRGQRGRRRAASARQRCSGPTCAGSPTADVAADAVWSGALGLPGPHNARNASMARAVLGGPGHPRRHGRRRPGPGGAGLRGAAQPLPLPGAGRRGGVRRRQPLDQRAPRPGRPGGLRRPAGGPARRRTRPWPRLRPAGPLRPRARHAHARGHHAGQRARGSAPPCAPDLRRGRRGVEVVDATSLEAAVEAAFGWAAPAGSGAVVLLSPAAPSFGRFADYRARACAFAAAARGVRHAAAERAL